ncbi:serine/threonine/tyrosine-protein kinase HT1 [Cajanus cajan]|uniref:serine/threonine/tyrosine-protein kinase HT1 n=1 Tax=Cajanus cajan TaxID=3821 RepID=UPI00098DCE14|nr:serine/threonine/tyrosine-protein kinase HT1 [Cajanus cajan]
MHGTYDHEDYSTLDICESPSFSIYMFSLNLDNKSEVDDDFVFDIDPTWLVDTRKLIVGELIAEGSRAIVYKGWYELNPVSIKVLLPMRTSDATSECKARFQREVNLLSKIKHKNIIKFIGASVEPSMMIITERVEGCSLMRYLESISPSTLSLEQCISFALDISRVMEYLHANGIIHRDLKLGNMFLAKDNMEILLTNFDIAREVISGEMTSEAGTYRYMAPELFSKDPLLKGAKKCYDHKADVYSFAMALWALIKNQTPFKGRSQLIAAYATVLNMRPSVEEFPKDLLPLLQSCWEEDPNLRPEFSEITQTLAEFLHNCLGITPEEQECPTTSVQEPIPYCAEDNSKHVHEAQSQNTNVSTMGQYQSISQTPSPNMSSKTTAFDLLSKVNVPLLHPDNEIVDLTEADSPPPEEQLLQLPFPTDHMPRHHVPWFHTITKSAATGRQPLYFPVKYFDVWGKDKYNFCVLINKDGEMVQADIKKPSTQRNKREFYVGKE